MSDFPKVKIVNQNESQFSTSCYINDKKMERVKSVDFHVDIDTAPTFDFEMIGMPEIEMIGDVRFSFTPKTVEEAVAVLRNELLKHDDFYKKFLSSVENAVRANQLSIPLRAPYWIAKDIVDRII